MNNYIHHALIFFALPLLLAGCATSPSSFNTPNASGYYASEPMQCVPYAREISGISIYGDAYTWWYQTPDHKRGTLPKKGAILVLSKSKKLSRGHLAVVKEIINPRKILVEHTNWGSDFETRRVIYKTMMVEDLSISNNWARVRFWNKDINAFGLPYDAYGFIYK